MLVPICRRITNFSVNHHKLIIIDTNGMFEDGIVNEVTDFRYIDDNQHFSSESEASDANEVTIIYQYFITNILP